MTKKFGRGIFFLFLVMILLPIASVYAQTSRIVNTQEDFLEALANENITHIVMGGDINTTQKITITRPVTVDGNGHTMKYVGTFGSTASTDKTVWGGIYLLQVYKTTAVIKDIKLTGGNAALLVNGGTVTLDGVIDVSGNGFGGIELGQGQGVTEKVHVVLTDETKLVNTTEDKEHPTLWVPEDSDAATIEMDGTAKSIASGDEVTLTEINALFQGTIENPKTGDPLTFFITTSFIAVLLFAVSYKKLRNAY